MGLSLMFGSGNFVRQLRQAALGTRAFPFRIRSPASGPEESHIESELLRKVDRSPEAAWNEFLERFAPAIFRVVCLFVDTYDERMDLFVYVTERLNADKMKRVRAYEFRPEAPCSFKSYLAVVVKNLALDFIRSVEGRYRPFRSLRDLDATDRLVFEQHIRDRRPLKQVQQSLEKQQGIRLDLAELKTRAERMEGSLSPSQRWRLLSRIWAHRQPLPIDPTQDTIDSGEHVLPLRSGHRDPEAEMGAESARRVMRQALEKIEPRKRLALALRYKDGLKVREAARVMSATDKQIEHWVREGTSTIRDHLRQQHVTRDDLDTDRLAEIWEESGEHLGHLGNDHERKDYYGDPSG